MFEMSMFEMSMFKVVYLARRTDVVSHEELVRHWREVNVVDIAAELEPDRYVVTFFSPKSTQRVAHEHAWDGMAVVWFADVERGRRVCEPVPAPAVRNGQAAMMERVVRFEAQEHVFFDRGPIPPDALKLTFLVAARPGVAHADVVEHWTTVHGPQVAAPMAQLAGALRYVASPARDDAGPYSGVTELWYADSATAAAHAQALVDDGFSRLADNTISLRGEELHVRP